MDDKDKFVIGVSLDTKDANAKLKDIKKQAGEIADELEGEHSLKLDNKKILESLKKIEEALHNIENASAQTSDSISSAFGIGKALIFYKAIKKVIGAGAELYKITSETANSITHLSNQAAQFGMSANSLKAWQTSFKALGLSANSVSNIFNTLQDQSIQQMMNPSAQIASWRVRMGIHEFKNGKRLTEEEKTMQAIQTLQRIPDDYRAMGMGLQGGFSKEDVIQLRKNPNFAKEYIAKQKNNNIVTDTQVEQAKKFTKKEAENSASIEAIRNRALMPMADSIANKVLPALENFALGLNGVASQLGIGEHSVAKGVGVTSHSISSAIKSNINKVTSGELFNNAKTLLNPSSYSSGNKLPNSVTNSINKHASSPQEAQMVASIIKAESGGKNVKSSTSSAYGIGQFTNGTWQDLMGSADKNNVDNQIIATIKNTRKYTNKATSLGVQPTTSLNNLHHHLPVGFTKYAQNPERYKTYEDLYNSFSPSKAREYKQANKGLLNKSLPPIITSKGAYIPGLGNAPTALSTDSSSIMSSIINNNNRNITNTSSTNIGAVNVSANNLQEFQNSIKQYSRMADMTNSMSGSLA